MAAQNRKSDTTLKDRLFNEFYGFSFFKAVALLESLHPEKKRIGETLEPANESVRFSVRPGFAFPASDISNLKENDKDEPADMDVSFLGLVGPSGVLPYWYNELAMKREREQDYSISAFYDIFHHRLVSLFYLSWKKHHFAANYLPGARDKLSKCLMSLIGLGTEKMLGKIGFSEESLLYYSGFLSRRVPSAVSVEATTEYFTGATARVEQFIERQLPLSEEDQTQIGITNSQLGIDAVVGSYVWECQTKFRVKLGPMRYPEFLKFLPTGKMYRSSFSLIRYMAGTEFEFEISLILKREEVPLCVLGERTEKSPRLGWNTWIRHPVFTHPDDPHVNFQEPLS